MPYAPWGSPSRCGASWNGRCVWYVAALCVLPSYNHPSNRALWSDVVALRDQFTIGQGSQGYRRWVESIREMVKGRQGDFQLPIARGGRP